MLEIKNLKFSYQNLHFQFNFNLKQGEKIGIGGKSGAGKSTLLSLISGFLTPHGGDILYKGKSILPLKISKRPLALLFQENNLFNHLNVEQNILLGLRHSLKANENEAKKIQRVLKLVELDGFAKRSIDELSGGQKQRVAIARILLQNKPILLLDEPFSALDYELRLEIWQLIHKLSTQHNLSVIIISHQLEELKASLDRVLILENEQLNEQN